MNDGPGAHRAGLLGHVKCAVGQSPIADCLFSLRQSQHFSVRGGVLEQFDLIAGTGNDPALPHDHGADRHLLRIIGAHGLAQSLAHEVMVALQIDDGFVRHGAGGELAEGVK